jgi:pimeloyl-ACP methyl ester carboxylesterase
VIRQLELAALTVLLLACAACDHAKGKKVDGEPGFRLEVNGHDLYYECHGHGTPTVVLEPGLDGTHLAWQWVQPELAGTTHVCSYDRAGLGLSSGAAPMRRTAQDVVDDLHTLLRIAGIDGPYVLAGHSLGGLFVRLYASEHPQGVAGVVLVDSAHPDQAERYLAALGRRRFVKRLIARKLRTFLSHPGSNAEGIDVLAAFARARTAGRLGDKPLAVITAGRENSPQLGRGLKNALDDVWLGLQEELAHLSSDSIQVIAATSGHDVISPDGQPALVVEAIRQVVHAARTGSRLAPCAIDVFARLGGRCVLQP